MASKCDIIRDAVAAAACGLCNPRACGPGGACPAGQTCTGGMCVGRPAACPEGLSTALCGVPGAANARMALFSDQYDPVNLFAGAARRAETTLAERIRVTQLRATERAVAGAYPGAAPGAARISWPDYEACLWTPSGAKAGPFGNVYFRRNDLQAFGMAPTYPVGGVFAQGAVWRPPKASPLPVAVDYAMNPDLAAILLFAFFVVLLAALLYRAYRDTKAGPERARRRAELARQRLEAADPYRGTAFESYPDPQARCRAYVEAMEAQGFGMGYYRRRCGLPPA